MTASVNRQGAGLEDIRQSVTDILSCLQDLVQLMEKSVECYRLGNLQEAHPIHSRCMEVVQDLLNAGMVIKTAVGLVRDDLDMEDFMGLESGGSAVGLFQDMLRVQTDQNWVLLADFLEGKMLPFLGRWSADLGDLQRKLR